MERLRVLKQETITTRCATMNVGNRIKKRRCKRGIEPEQKRSAREIIEDAEKVSFENWD